MLWRSDLPSTTNAEAAPRAEMTAIFLHDVRSGGLTPEDKSYATRQVARWTGLSETETCLGVHDALASSSLGVPIPIIILIALFVH
ncbi:hypothetical protein [Cupriavidus sp. D39]|uniref:hypothetical protein n=1 Tax=Cupriavidus sp. D39 TaxID=2997877 RepID=UPI00226E111D|nr:hypothetical protein [Cupriavidus sp. D39]MCY0856379.1 hypothetical protein [Cupriavidus sp. D39]